MTVAAEHIVSPRFHRYLTRMDDLRRNLPMIYRKITLEEIYTEELNHTIEAMTRAGGCVQPPGEIDHDTYFQASASYRAFSAASAHYVLWMIGRPYYKIYPDFITPMIETSLDIPCEHFKMPFPVWEIRLPEWAIPIDEHRYVTSLVLADQVTIESAATCPQLHPVAAKMYAGTCKSDKIAAEELGIPYEHQGTNIQMRLQYHDPFAEAHDNRGAFSEQLHLDTRISVGRALEIDREQGVSLVDSSEGLDAFPSVAAIDATMDKLWPLMLTMSLLATGADNIIEPDVLNKDLRKLKDADEEKALQLQAKASKRNNDGKGFTVGRQERVISVSARRRAEYGKTDRHLKYSHFRGQHLHGYHTRDGYVRKWVPMVVVRPDLKPNPNGRAGVQVRGV